MHFFLSNRLLSAASIRIFITLLTKYWSIIIFHSTWWLRTSFSCSLKNGKAFENEMVQLQNGWKILDVTIGFICFCSWFSVGDFFRECVLVYVSKDIVYLLNLFVHFYIPLWINGLVCCFSMNCVDVTIGMWKLEWDKENTFAQIKFMCLPNIVLHSFRLLFEFFTWKFGWCWRWWWWCSCCCCCCYCYGCCRLYALNCHLIRIYKKHSDRRNDPLAIYLLWNRWKWTLIIC